MPPAHGTESRYIHQGCRCDACKQATNKARNIRKRTPNVKIHGATGYSNGCRCDVCREGHRLYGAEYRKKTQLANQRVKGRG